MVFPLSYFNLIKITDLELTYNKMKIMKQHKYYLILTLVVFVITSCGLDNYDAPQSTLRGKITYNGEALGLRGTGQAVQLQLYQDGYELKNNIPVYVKQDGTFEALLFNGKYKMVTRDKNGPWVSTRDTIHFDLNGDTFVEVKVIPYFTISNAQVSFNGTQLTGGCKINQIVKDKKINYIAIFVNGTTFVDEQSNLFYIPPRTTTLDNVTFAFDISMLNDQQKATFNKQKALFARIGVKAEGADQAIYSEVFRLK